MEREKFRESFLSALELWKNGRSSILTERKLDSDLILAAKNGIELTLKVPKKVFDKVSIDRPLTRLDAVNFATRMEEDLVIFDIPSDINRGELGLRQRFRLGMVEYQDEQLLFISNSIDGIIAMFRGEDVEFLDIK